MEYLIGVRLPAQADRVVRPKILMDTGDLMPVVVPVCDDLAACAKRLSRERRARMTVVLHGLMKVAVLSAQPEILLVEQISKLRPRYFDDVRRVIHEQP